MKKNEILRILEQLGIHPGKKLGQNFLIDDNLLDFIVKTANPHPKDLIVEIGSGTACLTKKLLKSGAEIVAIEYDRRLAEYLRNSLKSPSLHLIENDACRIDLDSYLSQLFNSGRVKWYCVANLPYSISTPLVMKLIAMKNPPQKMLLMLQKETAERFTAKQGRKEYGAVSVIIRTFYEPKIIRAVSPQVFFPTPKVYSAILEMKIKNDKRIPQNEFELYQNLVKTAFHMRRKKLVKNLSQCYNEENLFHAFQQLSLNQNTRAEELNVTQFEDLFFVLRSEMSEKLEFRPLT